MNNNDYTSICKLSKLERELKDALADVLIEEEGKNMQDSTIKLSQIRDAVKTKVIGQDDAVNDVSLAVYKHIIRMDSLTCGIDTTPVSSNVLLMGNTGSGKTYICKVIAEMLHIPMLEIDCTNLSMGGPWHGDGLVDVLKRKAPPTFSIIFLDEFDKIISPSPSSTGKNVNGEIQQSILKTLEGGVNDGEYLFFLAGSFADFDKQNAANKAEVGFLGQKEDASNLTGAALRQKLIKYGMVPELAGRIHKMTKINKLTKKHFMDIITSDTTINPKAVYNNLFSEYNKKKIANKELESLAEEAEKMELGVRGFYNLIEEYIDKKLTTYDLAINIPYFVLPKSKR